MHQRWCPSQQPCPQTASGGQVHYSMLRDVSRGHVCLRGRSPGRWLEAPARQVRMASFRSCSDRVTLGDTNEVGRIAWTLAEAGNEPEERARAWTFSSRSLVYPALRSRQRRAASRFESRRLRFCESPSPLSVSQLVPQGVLVIAAQLLCLACASAIGARQAVACAAASHHPTCFRDSELAAAHLGMSALTT